jgi:hypothetical protein
VKCLGAEPVCPERIAIFEVFCSAKGIRASARLVWHTFLCYFYCFFLQLPMGLTMSMKSVAGVWFLLLFFISLLSSAAFPADETGAAFIADETGAAFPADETGAAFIADETGAAFPADEPGAAFPADEPGAAFIADESERTDTIVSPRLVPKYTEAMLESPFTGERVYADTSLTGFQLYDFFSPGNPFVAWKGNVGHPSWDMRLSSPTGMLSAFSAPFSLFASDPYQGYRFSQSDIPFYRPVHVFTDLYYVLGSSREQLFYVKHTQKLHESLYVGMQYRLVNSPGFFSRVGARNSNVYFNADYRHPGNRYMALGSFIVNRIENQQSGGLRNRADFEENPVRDSVFLYRAMSRYRETAVYLTQYYQLGFSGENEPDTLQEPSFLNLGRLGHHFSYQRQGFVFDEQARPTPFYDAAPVFSSQTYDSTRVHRLENRISWSNYPSDGKWNNQLFYFQASLTHQLVNIRLPDFSTINPDSVSSPDRENYPLSKTSYNHLRPAARVESNPLQLVSFYGSGSYTIGGYSGGDYSIAGGLRAGGTGRGWEVDVSAGMDRREAPYFLKRYTGNYISWDNPFEKMSLLYGGVKLSNAIVALQGNFYSLGRMVYMNAGGLPEQHAETIPAFSASASADLGIGAFRSNHKLHYQRAGAEGFDRFPGFMSYHSVYADFSMFDQALFVQAGVDLTYNVPYTPMAYMPVVWQFYAQDEFRSGQVFMVDLFGNFRIQRTRFFVKLHNVIGLVYDTSPVYSIPFYPLPEAAFKFGLSWMFFD